MTGELKEIGVDVGHRRVGRLRRDNGIVVERTRKFKVEEGQKMIRGIIFPTIGFFSSFITDSQNLAPSLSAIC